MLKVTGAEPAPPVGNVHASDLQWVYAANGLGPVEKDLSNGASAAGDGSPITMQGASYEKGLGVAGASAVIYRLSGACSTFTADLGIDDSTGGNGSVVFQVWADDEQLYESGVVTAATPVESITIDVTGKSRLKLMVTNGGDNSSWDRANWADAKLDCAP
jgi:alpha-galactosidase